VKSANIRDPDSLAGIRPAAFKGDYRLRSGAVFRTGSTSDTVFLRFDDKKFLQMGQNRRTAGRPGVAFGAPGSLTVETSTLSLPRSASAVELARWVVTKPPRQSAVRVALCRRVSHGGGPTQIGRC